MKTPHLGHRNLIGFFATIIVLAVGTVSAQTWTKTIWTQDGWQVVDQDQATVTSNSANNNNIEIQQSANYSEQVVLLPEDLPDSQKDISAQWAAIALDTIEDIQPIVVIPSSTFPDQTNAEKIEEQPIVTNNLPGSKLGHTLVRVNETVETYGTKRLGTNIGWYDQYGAAAYFKNVVPNPGFESMEMAMLFLAGSNATANRLIAHEAWRVGWNTQPADSWKDATYEILQGPARGRTGKVLRSGVEGGRPAFYVGNNNIKPNYRDAIVVRKQFDGYFSETPTNYYTVEPNEVRPGSPGKQSLRLHPSNYKPAFYVPLDSYSRDFNSEAGKTRILEGEWEYSVWVKPTTADQTLEIKFQRVREQVFYEEIIPLVPGWQKIERRFTIEPGKDAYQVGAVNPITFEIRIESKDQDVIIDDIYLGERGAINPTIFTDAFVDKLKELNPGILRDWGYQLGSSLDNQLAVPHARRTNNYKPTDPLDKAVRFHYSLHEFLELSRVVGSEPWYVIPPTFSPSELRNLIAYLSAPAGSHPYANLRAELGMPTPWTNIFGKIHLEYGNEMWGGSHSGDPFQGASLYDGYQIGEVGNNRLSIMRSSPHMNNKINLILGGQAGYPERQLEIESNSTAHDTIAIAPYYNGEYTTVYNDQDLYYSTFALGIQNANAGGKVDKSKNYVSENGHNLAIYEINSHLNAGWMPNYNRNQYLTSQAGGMSLPLHMLEYMSEQDIVDQAAYTALQYSVHQVGSPENLVKLWGMWIDLEGRGLKRPTGLGLEIVNKVVGGDMLETEQGGKNPTWKQRPINGIAEDMDVPFIHSYAFRQGYKYGIVLFNLNLYESQWVELDLPNHRTYKNGEMHTLTAKNYDDNNEVNENVKIISQPYNMHDGVKITLPPHSIVVLEMDG